MPGLGRLQRINCGDYSKAVSNNALRREEEWEQIESARTEPPVETAICDNSRERQLIDAALDSLSEREQLVIRTTFQYFRLGEQFQRLPNKVVQNLSAQLGTTPENLRKIRERALVKIREFVNEHTSSCKKKPSNEFKNA